MRRTMMLAVLAAPLMGAAVPKIIVTGWDIGNVTPQRIAETAEKWERLPIDGVMFSLNLRDDFKDEQDGYLRVAMPRVWPCEKLEKRFVPVFRQAVKYRPFANSFAASMYQPVKRMDWRDDRSWAALAANMRTLARISKAGGLKGIVLDTEDYWKARQYALLPGDLMTYEEASTVARERGREVFKGVFEEFPDIDILTFWWLSIRLEYLRAYDIVEAAKSLGDLLPAFTDGVLDVMPSTARLFDGNEHTYHWSHWRNFVAQRASHQLLVSPENRAKFRAQTGVSSAFYLDMFINPEKTADGSPHPFYMAPAGGRRLNRFLDRCEDAMLMSEEYIWMFGENRSWIDWGEFEYCKNYEKAYTGGTWESALPGFTEELSILKDPRGSLLPRLKKMKALGKAADVAGEIVKKGKWSYTCEVQGVGYGEWYAVCIETTCEAPNASITLKRNGAPVWDRPGGFVVFDRGDCSGIRRGIGFQRIWGDADSFEVLLTYGMNKAQIKDVKIRVYRVFTPMR